MSVLTALEIAFPTVLLHLNMGKGFTAIIRLLQLVADSDYFYELKQQIFFNFSLSLSLAFVSCLFLPSDHVNQSLFDFDNSLHSFISVYCDFGFLVMTFEI